MICAELQFEECPKLLALKDVLREIETEVDNNHQLSANKFSSACCTLIVARDDRMCSQIHDVRPTFICS